MNNSFSASGNGYTTTDGSVVKGRAGGGVSAPSSSIAYLHSFLKMLDVQIEISPLNWGGGGFLATVTRSPAGGYGEGFVKKVYFDAQGNYHAYGDEISVIFPKI